jgi:hypothetical protein
MLNMLAARSTVLDIFSYVITGSNSARNLDEYYAGRVCYILNTIFRPTKFQ